MNISRAEQSAIKHNQEQYRLDQARMEKQREQDYAKKNEDLIKLSQNEYQGIFD